MYRLRHIYLLCQKFQKDISSIFHDDDNDDYDDKDNKENKVSHIQTLRRNISASKTHREEIKTLIRYFGRKLSIEPI